MKRLSFAPLLIIAVITFTGFKPHERPVDQTGFTITVNGDQFKNQTFYIPATTANYANLYFDFKKDEKAKRTVLVGFKPDNSLQLLIDVPIHRTPGNFTFIEDNIPVYMGFQFTYEKDGGPSTYMPGKMTVNITKYGNVGEFIEGNFSGTLQPRIGAKEAITASGTFKVKRLKDRT